MAKWLLVGDPHVVVDELDDCRRLVDGILETVHNEKPDYVLFLGDQFNNHAIVHVEAIAFWRDAFKRLSASGAEVYALVGNHDMPGDGVSQSHAMMACEGTGVRIVDRPLAVGAALLVPYRHSGEVFKTDIQTGNRKTIFCHQTFDGGKYENGFYAKDGIALEGLEEFWFISGHIHTPQSFANVTYIGAPRWRSLSDVGVDRALALVEVDDGARPTVLKLFDTGAWCQKLVHVVDRQDQPQEPDINPGWRYIVDIHGDEAYIQARRPLWAGCRIRTFKSRTESKPVSESMGINRALSVFLETYRPKYGTDSAILREMVAKRLGGQ